MKPQYALHLLLRKRYKAISGEPVSRYVSLDRKDAYVNYNAGKVKKESKHSIFQRLRMVEKGGAEGWCGC